MYRPDKPNAFPLSNRAAATMLQCAQKTAAKAVGELVERGWLILERSGGTEGARCARGRVVSLTKWGTDARDPYEPFRHWRPADSEGGKK